mmetsp:Transcript_103149/g.199861  ORF Transcript_103149/g.199861 Transcript_103149/m.199861 type:complete len:669 (+) Transcript_103149:2-2008(+)
MSIKGINWNPVPVGSQQGDGGGVNFRGFVETDSELMAAAGVNAVRTYEPIDDPEVLDVLWRKRIFVVNTVYVAGMADPNSVVEPVTKLRNHPAILMWAIGNEWNYNRLYSPMELEDAMVRVQQVAQIIRSVDPTHPIATVYGMMPGEAVISGLPDIDVWGITAYNGLTFGRLFDQWAAVSEKPMFIAEFGADAYNAQVGAVDEGDQAKATQVLTAQIVAHLSTGNSGVCLGGFIFELADEWWKDGQGSPSTHDTGGVAPGIGPFPDHIFNEEYWGLVRMDGTPRQAYHTYASITVPGAATGIARPSASDILSGYRLRACGSSPGCGQKLGNCCPSADGVHQSCCTSVQRSVGGGTATNPPAPAPGPWASPAAVPVTQTGIQSTDSVAAPNTDSEEVPVAVQNDASSSCTFNEAVPCCQDEACGSCAGDQCCPSNRGLVTCPSSPKALGTGCLLPKLYDCTGQTGLVPPVTASPPGGAQSPSANTPSGPDGTGMLGPVAERHNGGGGVPILMVVLAVLLTMAAFAGAGALYYVVWKKVKAGLTSRTGEDTRGIVAVYEQAPGAALEVKTKAPRGRASSSSPAAGHFAGTGQIGGSRSRSGSAGANDTPTRANSGNVGTPARNGNVGGAGAAADPAAAVGAAEAGAVGPAATPGASPPGAGSPWVMWVRG